MKKFIFFAIINLINAFDICVVGGSSGVGKELIYQSLEKNKKVLALTNNPNKVCIPYRGKGLTEIYNKNELITNNNLILDKYKNSNEYLFKNIVFTTNGLPFRKDYSFNITKYILNNHNLYQNLSPIYKNTCNWEKKWIQLQKITVFVIILNKYLMFIYLFNV